VTHSSIKELVADDSTDIILHEASFYSARPPSGDTPNPPE